MSETTKNLPRDVFLYLLSIVTLVVSAVYFGILVFQYINIYFPDVLADYYMPTSAYLGTIRQSLAFVIVVFPVYIWASRFLRRDMEANPEKKELKIRKWLLYLTVFAAGLTIIGDLVALLNTFLEGEITARFILKVLTIFFIAGSVFYYYFKELKSDKFPRAFPWVVIVVVLAAVVFGFFVAGSPTSRRTERFDERRVQDLSVIQSHVISYWQNKSALPGNLGELTDDLLGVVVPVDPKTGNAYEYRVMGDLKFQLCATFETSSNENNNGRIKPMPALPMSYPYPGGKVETWQHSTGHACFERAIDPDFFKIEKPRPL
ncbi:MAG: hypothetical protein HYT67_01865 [Candidatus Yanofskybacteria bacterium]|nr:hypothetical protein [Candidatus Yanofskybacteria bacterium]